MQTISARISGFIVLGLVVLALAGCTLSTQQHRPGPEHINSPLDALQSTPAPASVDSNNSSQGLTRDVEQLQNARTTYQRAKQRQRARIKRDQSKCRHARNKKEVPITEGGEAHATFCEQTP